MVSCENPLQLLVTYNWCGGLVVEHPPTIKRPGFKSRSSQTKKTLKMLPKCILVWCSTCIAWSTEVQHAWLPWHHNIHVFLESLIFHIAIKTNSSEVIWGQKLQIFVCVWSPKDWPALLLAFFQCFELFIFLMTSQEFNTSALNFLTCLLSF